MVKFPIIRALVEYLLNPTKQTVRACSLFLAAKSYLAQDDQLEAAAS